MSDWPLTVTSLTGTTNQVTVSASNGDITVSIPASSQLSLAKITNLTSNGFVTTGSGDGTLSILADPLVAGHGGTGLSTYAVGDLIYASATTPTLSRLADVAVGSYLRSGGVNTAPLWSTVTLPNTTTINRIWYSSATNTVSEITTANNAVLVTSATGVPSIAATSANLQVSSSVLDTIQGIQTSSTPQFARLGLGVAADATSLITAQATASGLNVGLLLNEQTNNASSRNWFIGAATGSAALGTLAFHAGTAQQGAPASTPVIAFGPTGTFTFNGVGPNAIGGATDGNTQLYIHGSFTGSGPTQGIDMGSTLNGVAGGDIYGFILNPVLVEAGSGTHSTLIGLKVNPSITNGAATTTDAIGIDIVTFAAATGTTNATGLRVAAPTGATNNYAINVTSGNSVFQSVFSGTAPNTSATLAIARNSATPTWAATTAAGWFAADTATSNPLVVEDVRSVNDSRQAVFFIRNTANVGTITTTASATAYNTSSDIRLKNDLGIASDLTALRHLIIHDFTWKLDGTPGRGVSAQEALAVAPYAVHEGSDELTDKGQLKNPWSVDYSKFVPDIIVGWQQHDDELTSMRARIERLEGKVN